MDAPRGPDDVPRRRASARRTALILGGVALLVYGYAMYKTISAGASA